MSNRSRGGWRGRGNYRGRGGGRGGGNGGAGGKPGKVKMTFVNSRLHLSFSYNKTLIDHVRAIEVWVSKKFYTLSLFVAQKALTPKVGNWYKP